MKTKIITGNTNLIVLNLKIKYILLNDLKNVYIIYSDHNYVFNVIVFLYYFEYTKCKQEKMHTYNLMKKKSIYSKS